MIAGLKPYPQYRESSVPWLAHVPSHWGVLRAKYCFREVDERSLTGAEDLLSVSHIFGVKKRSESNATMFLAKSNKGHKLCSPGDLIINTMWAWMGALGVSPHEGIVSPSYAVYRPTKGNPMLNQYADYLVRSPLYVSNYIIRSTGIHSSRLRLYPEQFLRVPLLCPLQGEQAAIARFLSSVNARLERAIRAKKKLIGLLNEERQIVIGCAVMSGFNAAARLKPAGISWLGDVPEHWTITRLKTLSKFVTSGSRGWARYYSDEGPLFLRIGNISTSSVDLRLKRITRVSPPADAEGERTRVRENDLLLSITAQIGAVGIVPAGLGEAYVNQHTALIRLKNCLCNPRWVAYCLLSEFGKTQCRLRTAGGTKVGLTLDDVKTLLVLLPPPAEQNGIVREIDDRTASMDVAIARAEREIELIREYRTRMITDVVTGQLDVVSAAERLPVEIEGPEAAPESDADGETEDLLEEVSEDA
jgi:type I restriction enzyme, S subunit